MSTTQEAPALIQYACERCKTRFVLPPSRRRLGFGGRLRATGMALSRTLRFHEGLGSTFDGARRQLLAKMDDDAYQSFVQSFKFCHECRQFVCSECWSTSRKTCLGCFAKAAGTTIRQRPPFAPEGPSIPRPVAAAAPTARRRRLRTDASLLVMAAAVILLAFELVIMLPGIGRSNDGGPGATNPVAAVTPSPTPTDAPTATPAPIATLVPTASPSPTATPTATPTASPSPSPTASPSPSASVTPSPPPPKPYPTYVSLSCSPGTNKIACTWNNYDGRATGMTWRLDGAGGPLIKNKVLPAYTFTDNASGFVTVTVTVKIGGHTISATKTNIPIN